MKTHACPYVASTETVVGPSNSELDAKRRLALAGVFDEITKLTTRAHPLGVGEKAKALCALGEAVESLSMEDVIRALTP
jgi:hypothetical protein